MPIDPLLGPLADNGGTTLTHALLPGSPAINMGDPGFSGPPDFDQRGEPFARVYGAAIDIGAYEAQPLHADFDGDHDVDGDDFFIWQRGLGTPNATKQDGDANGDMVVNGTDLAVWEDEYGLVDPTELSSLLVTTEQDTIDAYDGLTSAPATNGQLVDLAIAAKLLVADVGLRDAEYVDEESSAETAHTEAFAALVDSPRHDEGAAGVLAGEHPLDFLEDSGEGDLADQWLELLDDVPLGGQLVPNL